MAKLNLKENNISEAFLSSWIGQDDKTPQIWLIGNFQVVLVQTSAETIIQLHINGTCSFSPAKI